MRQLIYFLLCLLVVSGHAQDRRRAMMKPRAAVAAGNPFTFVSSANTDNFGSGDSCNSEVIDTTGAKLLIATVSWFSLITADGTLSDGAPSNVWTPLTKRVQGNTSHQIFYCISPTTSGSHEFFFAGSSTFASIQISAWSHTGTPAYDGQQNGATSASATTLATGSVTPTQDYTLIIAGCGAASDATFTGIDSSFTLQENNAAVSGTAIGGAHAYKFVSPAAANNPTWTVNTPTVVMAAIAVFK